MINDIVSRLKSISLFKDFKKTEKELALVAKIIKNP